MPKPESPEDRRLKDGCRNKAVRSAKIGYVEGYLKNVRPGPSTVGREVMTARFRTFRKHRRPCGQPAVVGGIGCFRPVPLQAGHFKRINATPSDLPFKSTGFAT